MTDDFLEYRQELENALTKCAANFEQAIEDLDDAESRRWIELLRAELNYLHDLT